MIFIWAPAFFIMSLPLFHGPSNHLLELATESHPYLAGGFILLVTGLLGETLKARTLRREISPTGLFYLSFMWWLCGAAAALLFPMINLGVSWSQALGFLPGGGYSTAGAPFLAIITSFFFTTPFFTALMLNLMAIPLWFLRRVILAAASWTPQYFWPGAENSLNHAVKTVNWPAFVKNEIWQTLCIRLSLMTLVIMMPDKYWLYLTGWLIVISIMLGDVSMGGGRSPKS